jgi:hypothetical protein
MEYFLQDMLYFLIGLAFFFVLAGHMLYRRRFPRGAGSLLGLVLLLSTAGLSDLAFRLYPQPNLVLLADSVNVFCYAFILAIFLHYSLAYSAKQTIWTETKLYLALYLPALAISGFYALSPLMISGLVASPLGFQLDYNPGYWIVVLYGLSLTLSCIYLNLGHIESSKPAGEKNRSVFLLFTLLLLVYFYNSSLILPFLFQTVNFASPLPTTFAIMVLTYAYLRYNYFALEQLESEASQT